MTKKTKPLQNAAWVQGEISLAGTLDKRMIKLLRAIDELGSINQAAKQVGLSYKGAWQIIERANNFSPKVLISTATGGSKGGGTSLTSAGRALLALFTSLEYRHQQFLQQLNQELEADTDTLLLLKPLNIKTSATNQLFGTIVAIQTGSIYVEVLAALKGGENIVISLTIAELESLQISIGREVLLLINSTEINLLTDLADYRLSARNCLPGSVIRIHDDGIESEVVLRLPGDDSLTVMLTQPSTAALGLAPGVPAYAVFKSNAVILAVII
ncbi:TOBE domain-containing protein [Methylomonas paludis]|uniref:TOBE domain-containing protein n=1 Tax=Methylomonas paludis TaxID=1173101 RepID=A0A975MNN3_9GAMM|nr:TOBE domain-containing protein [Methylomonas paludis]QWF71110.1 TOBE domain-containing protein [Methylomonas paludis]